MDEAKNDLKGKRRGVWVQLGDEGREQLEAASETLSMEPQQVARLLIERHLNCMAGDALEELQRRVESLQSPHAAALADDSESPF